MVESGLPNPDSADQIRKRMVNHPPKYATIMGKHIVDYQMRSHYGMVASAGIAVDDSKPPKSHYDFLAVSKAHPKWKPGIWDRYVDQKRRKDYVIRMANTKSLTDSKPPEAACEYSSDRRRYRQHIVQTSGFKMSSGTEVMWSWSKEQTALRHLARHSRAVQVSKGWTDSGPPEKAMQFREFRRTFRKPAIVDATPPKSIYGHLCDQKKKRRRNTIPVTSTAVHFATTEGSELPKRRSTSHGHPQAHKSEDQLFRRDPDDSVAEKRVWMPDSRSFVRKEVSAVAKKGSGGGLVGHGCRGVHTSERQTTAPTSTTQYALPKTGPGSPKLVASQSSKSVKLNMYSLDRAERPVSRECLPVRRPGQQLNHPRRVNTPEPPKSRTGTPTSFSVTACNRSFEAECSPGDGLPYEGLEGLKEEEEEEYEQDFDFDDLDERSADQDLEKDDLESQIDMVDDS